MEELLERMGEAVAALERAMERMEERAVTISAEADERVGQIVAMVEGQREAELAERLRIAEAKLLEAESKIAEAADKIAAMSAAAETANATVTGRKTAAVGMVATLAKQGISASALEGLESGRIEAASLDAALGSLSIEQRFAVKAEMLRTGLLG